METKVDPMPDILRVPEIQSPPQALMNGYPIRREAAQADYVANQVEARSGALQRPVVTQTIASTRRDPANVDNSIILAGTVCMFCASAALTGNTPPSRITDICAVSGVLGTLLACLSLFLTKQGAYVMATRFLMFSSACALASMICLVAGTQTWVTTALTVVCMVIIMVWTLRERKKRGRIGDAEIGLV